MKRLKDLWSDVMYEFGELAIWFGYRFPHNRRIRIKRTIDNIIFYTIPIVLLLIFVSSTAPNIATEKLSVTYNITNEAEIVAEAELSGDVVLGKAIKEVIKTQCNLRKVDINLVYAIINSPEVEDEYRIGIMKLHPQLREKYDKQMGKGPGILESIYSNAVAGVDRLKWSLDKNSTLEGALMAYYYTKPVAQEMWADGVKTTEWVESVKEELK